MRKEENRSLSVGRVCREEGIAVTADGSEVWVTVWELGPPPPPDGKFTLEYLTEFIDRCGEEIISKA